jgi:molybdenum cofactor biosynthesis enzyme MoaA
MASSEHNRQFNLQLTSQQRATLGYWSSQWGISMSEVLRKHINQLQQFQEIEVSARKTPEFVKKDFHFEPESNMSFHLVSTRPTGFCRPCNKTRLHENGKCISCGEWVIGG